MNTQNLIDTADLDSGLTEELATHSAEMAWSLFGIASVMSAFLAWNALDLRSENIELRERVAAMQSEVSAMREYNDSWTCTYDRKDKRSSQGIIKSCIRTERF